MVVLRALHVTYVFEGGWSVYVIGKSYFHESNATNAMAGSVSQNITEKIDAALGPVIRYF